MKAILLFLISINVYSTNFDIFPEFHWTPEKPFENIFKSLRSDLLLYKRNKIRFFNEINCVYFVDKLSDVNTPDALEICFDKFYESNGRLFQEAKFSYKNKTRTLQFYSYDQNFKGFNTKDLETLSFPKTKDMPKNLTLKVVENDYLFEFDTEGEEYNHTFTTLSFGYKYTFKQIKRNDDQYIQHYHGSCSSCSNYHYSATATRVDVDNFEITYGINTQSGEIGPQRFLELFNEGYIGILSRSSGNLDILD